MSPLAVRRSLLDRLSVQVPTSLYHQEPAADYQSGLAIQWLGTAGFRIVSGGHHFWLDPHLSRQDVPELLFGQIEPELERIRADVDVAHAVAVGHSHFDHALDAPAIAKLHQARLYGSEDTLNWARGYGVDASLLRELRGEGETYDEGPFALRAVKSEHSALFGGRIPFPGHIATALRGPAHMSNWRCGPVFGLHLQAAGTSVYHVGSAALVEAELSGVQADVVLCCTIGRHATPNFTRRVVDALQPKLLIPCHWDQFWRPLDAPVRQIPGNDLEGFLAEVAACPNAPETRVLPFRGWTQVVERVSALDPTGS